MLIVSIISGFASGLIKVAGFPGRLDVRCGAGGSLA
jgi:hypothetical protein